MEGFSETSKCDLRDYLPTLIFNFSFNLEEFLTDLFPESSMDDLWESSVFDI